MSIGHDSNYNYQGPGPYSLRPICPLPPEVLIEGLCTFEVWEPEMWDLSVDGETRVERDARRENAMQICRLCPVRELCEAYAKKSGVVGVWGGKLFRASETTDPHPEVGTSGRGIGAPKDSISDTEIPVSQLAR